MCKKKKIIKLILLTIFQVIWKKMNSKAFEGSSRKRCPKLRINGYIILAICFWVMTFIDWKSSGMS